MSDAQDTQNSDSQIRMYKEQKRGLALIMNINNFSSKERMDSKRDIENLMKSLQKQEFEIEFAENLTKSQIEKLLQEKSSISHKDFDCFLCIIISHVDDEKAIVTSDSELISFEQIMEPFKSCPSLMNKPKILFIQAYREHNSIELSRESERDSQMIVTTGDCSLSEDFLSIISQNVNILKFENEFELAVSYSTFTNYLELGYIVDSYFLAKSVMNKLKEFRNDEETDQILKESRFLVERKFLNDMMKSFVKPMQHSHKNTNSNLKDKIQQLEAEKKTVEESGNKMIKKISKELKKEIDLRKELQKNADLDKANGETNGTNGEAHTNGTNGAETNGTNGHHEATNFDSKVIVLMKV